MKKDFENITGELNDLHKEIAELKKIVLKQNEQIVELKKLISSVTTVKIEEDGKKSTESYGNLILDEIISVKKKLEGVSVDGLRGGSDVATIINKDGNDEFSLSELKGELLKLADMMSV